ncbi:MAG: cytochrome P460 family protein [Vicinamibacterales bacterium]
MFNRKSGMISVAVAGVVLGIGCGSQTSPPTAPSSTSSAIRDDAAFFRQITQIDPLSRYTVLPNAEEFATGRLDGSEAHRPIIRVSLNAAAMGSLRNGRLAPGATFAEGSIVLKELRSSAAASTSLYVVMMKDSGNALAGDGWLWAEYGPTGSVTFSVSNRGSACISCHRRQHGPQNDLVRSFERQQ